jgi:steroid 5-alpha reductase family enzyme
MAFIQNWILIGHALPIYYIATNTASGRLTEQQPLNVLDIIVACLFMFFFLYEAVADEQQWIFQQKKHDWLKNPNSGNYTQEDINDFKR